MAVLGVAGGVIWATLEVTGGCSAIPPGKECWQGRAMLLGTAVLIAVCTGTVGWGKTADGEEEGGAEKG